MVKKSAVSSDPVKKPQKPDLAQAACVLRLLGYSQEKAAETAGVSVRQLIEWEKCSWWADYEAEAHRRWLRGLAETTRVALPKHVKEDPATARFAAERLFPELNPPKVRAELTGKDGGPIKTTGVLVVPGVEDEEGWEEE